MEYNIRNKCMISLSFDDGRIDNYTIAVPILRKYGLKATFNITTGYVDCTGNDLPFPVPAMTKENVIELYNDNLFEIAGHGDMHQNDFIDINNGINKLSEWLNNGKPFNSIGFASPGSDYVRTPEFIKKLQGINMKYVRISCYYNKFKWFKVLCRKVSRVIKLPFLYRLAYQDSCFNSYDGFHLYSVPVLHQATYPQLLSLIKYAIKEKKSLILMLHSVAGKNDALYADNWSMGVEVFEKLCESLAKYQKDGDCEVCKTLEIVNN